MPEAQPLRVVVAGGGITGLAAAHRLVELAAENARALHLTLLEAEARVGGVICTERCGGFVIELGPDSILAEHPWAVELCERVGLGPRMIGTRSEQQQTYVVHRGRLEPLPDGFVLMAPARLLPVLRSRLFSWRGKLRMAADLLLPRGGGDDESLAGFVRRRFGHEVLERVVQPLIGGIYTADPEVLSLAATMPRFLELERDRRSVIWAMRSARHRGAARHGQSGARWSLFVSLDDGLQTLADTLVQRLPEGALRLGHRVRSVDRGRTWRVVAENGQSFTADAVIVAVPAYHAADLLHAVDAALAAELEAIDYASAAVVTLAFEEAAFHAPLGGFGFVVPHVEGRSILACSYSSKKWPGRAPEGRVLLRAFAGGALQPEVLKVDDGALISIVRRELRDLLGIDAEPSLVRVARWPRSMPQYNVGHLQRLARIEQRLARHAGLHLAGNAYGGVGIPHCIHSGETAAEKVFAQQARSQRDRS